MGPGGREANRFRRSSAPPPKIRVRVVTSQDRVAWARMRHRLWPEHSFEELLRDADSLLASEKRGDFRRASMPATVLIAHLADGAAVGFAEVDLRPYADGCRSSPVGYLEGWYVESEHRRKGIGAVLVRAAERWAAELGCEEMASDTGLENSVSQRAHRTLGYHEVERLVHFRRALKRTPPARTVSGSRSVRFSATGR